ncbi:hypothetical protein [Nocardia abscessus]|uniref:hypothetical protein n=1 Tax=Nocardia abscessus TaxID=120957 RepID=UPI0024560539|nr:hypothetical protein [Nocardia abscessus]
MTPTTLHPIRFPFIPATGSLLVDSGVCSEITERLARDLLDSGLRVHKLRMLIDLDSEIPAHIRTALDSVLADLDTVLRDAGLTALAVAREAQTGPSRHRCHDGHNWGQRPLQLGGSPYLGRPGPAVAAEPAGHCAVERGHFPRGNEPHPYPTPRRRTQP